MPSKTAPGPCRKRLGSDHDRFVAFAFASAALMIEATPDGTIGYAAGAFRTEFGSAAESFIGRKLQELVAPTDHDALTEGLLLLRERGRLLPITIRLANAARTSLALSGLMLPANGRAPSLCLTFAPLPSPPGHAIGTAPGLVRAAEARLRSGQRSDLQLLEVSGSQTLDRDAIGSALQILAPNVLTGEIAPGRFGLLSTSEISAAEILGVAKTLEDALRAKGLPVQVASCELTLSMEGLSANQAARALRHALASFARGGGQGLAAAGFTAGLSGYLQRASAHVGALRRAIRAGQFDMTFQPIVALADRRLHHYEALIRPQPIPECSLTSPQEFILLVETLGLADEVDRVVAQKSCDAAKSSGAAIAFNISAQSAENPVFRKQLVTSLEIHPAVQAGLVSIELTETADIEDIEETVRTIAALRNLGITFCMDDFGAGSADVRLLRTLGADIVKLDGSYVPGVTHAGRERAFVAGLIDIAHAAGATVVAERVETQDEADTLKALGAEYGQGWLFGRPGPLPATPAPTAAARRRGAQESWG